MAWPKRVTRSSGGAAKDGRTTGSVQSITDWCSDKRGRAYHHVPRPFRLRGNGRPDDLARTGDAIERRPQGPSFPAEEAPMSVCKRLREHLDARNVRYVVIAHSRAVTAQEIAAALHVPGREMAKTVVVASSQGLALCVMRAMDQVDVDRVAARLASPYARLATEQEFRDRFPDCETGAMPPLGNLYNVPTLVDEELSHDREIVFNAGTHVDAIRMAYADFAAIAKPVVGRFASSLAGAID